MDEIEKFPRRSRKISRTFATTVTSTRCRVYGSHHTHAHVLAELHAYAPLVSVSSYCVVFDTLIEQLPDHLNDQRPWGVNDNPITAVATFLASLSERPMKVVDGKALRFEIDDSIDSKLLISAAPCGYLRRAEV